MKQKKKGSSIKAVVKLPKPKYKWGYTQKELISFMSKNEFNEFVKWMYGQTITINKKRETIYYTWDVKKFLNLIRCGM